MDLMELAPEGPNGLWCCVCRRRRMMRRANTMTKRPLPRDPHQWAAD